METRDLILLLVDKSTNAFGQLYGLTEVAKLKKGLTIIQNTIHESFNLNSIYFSKKSLSEILSKELFNNEQINLLANLLWAQADILLKLEQPQDSIGLYNSALQLLNWNNIQPSENSRLETKKRITELEETITSLKINDNLILKT